MNFLRFLTAEIPLSIFENYIVRGFFAPMPFQEVRSRLQRRILPGKTFNLYLHIPFCAEDCSYCHCTHRRLRSKKELPDYLEFLGSQISSFAPLFDSVEMTSLYFGGGTPSLLGASALEGLFEDLRKHFDFKAGFQTNFEAHPATLTSEKVAALKRWGVDRISLGVQTLDSLVLKAIGRIQSRSLVEDCIKNIRKAGIEHLNVDLVAGLPRQTVASFLQDLEEVIQCKPEILHITPFSDVFSTAYYRAHRLDFPEFIKRRHAMVLEAKHLLHDKGYRRHGFEAYQRQRGGDNCQQLLFLNTFTNILGLGWNAQSMFCGGVVFRTLDKGAGAFYEGTSVDERYAMANFLIFHLLKGVTSAEFRRVSGRDLTDVFRDEIALLERSGLVGARRQGFKYTGQWTPEGLFEYFAATKIFYGKEMIGRLKVLLKDRYDRRHQYTFKQDGFVSKGIDPFFMNTFYDLGY